MSPVEPDVGTAPLTSWHKIALAVTALIYLGVVAGVCAFVDEKTLHTALSLPISVVAALLGLSLTNYAVRAWRWAVLGRHLGIDASFGRNVLYYLAGFSLTSTPGKAGEAVRLWFLKSAHNVPYSRSFPLMFADRIIDMWAVMLLTLISIAGFAEYRWQGIVVGTLIALVSVPILFPQRFEAVLEAMLVRAPFGSKWIDATRRLVRTMADLRDWRTYGLTILPTVGGWLAECAALYLLLQHFGADVTFLNAIFIFSFSLIVGAISMFPGGLGSTEATIIILLKALGVDLGVALAVTAIVRITTFWFAVAIGLILLPVALNATMRSTRSPTAQGPGLS